MMRKHFSKYITQNECTLLVIPDEVIWITWICLDFFVFTNWLL